MGLSLLVSGRDNSNLLQIRHIPKMKHKPQSLTSWVTLVALAIPAVVATFSSLSPVSLFAQPPQGSADSALNTSSLSSAQVFDGVNAKLAGLNSLSCELNQTVDMAGKRFQAVGKYMQATGNRMRLEYRIFPVRATQASDRAASAIDSEPLDTSDIKVTGSLTQVSDGSVLWSYWVNGDQKKLTRRNIQEIVDAAGQVPNYSTAKSLQDLGVGGLLALMSNLQAGMEFGAVREQMVGNAKLLILSGRWTLKSRKDIFQLPDDSDAPLPEYVPDYVRVYVDAEGMLPRRVQYLKRHPNPELKQIRPLVTLDFRAFKANVDVLDQTFEFVRPDDETIPEADLTSQVIENIKAAAQETAEPASVSESADSN